MKISTILGVAIIKLSRNDATNVDSAVTLALSSLMLKDGYVVRKTNVFRDIMVGFENMGYQNTSVGASFRRQHERRQSDMMFIMLAKELAIEQGL